MLQKYIYIFVEASTSSYDDNIQHDNEKVRELSDFDEKGMIYYFAIFRNENKLIQIYKQNNSKNEYIILQMAFVGLIKQFFYFFLYTKSMKIK